MVFEKVQKIIQDYLTYSKPITEHTKEINIQEELPIVLKLLQPLANYYSVKIISDLSSTSLIDGDRAKFQHTFINIIKNNIVVGVIDLDSDLFDNYTLEDVAILEQVANIISELF